MTFRKQFGKAPQGARLSRIRGSPQYDRAAGAFKNEHTTPTFSPGFNGRKVLYDYLFKKHPNVKPNHPLPSIRTDLNGLNLQQSVLIWFGHSSYYFQINGKRFLVDPVFSGNAAPVTGANRSFKGTDLYNASDMPFIDYLLITHDHYDHLDYPTIKNLRPKVKHVICGLGVGQHFEYWGYDPKSVTELDWHASLPLDHPIKLYTAPARHFSGRGLKRNNTLWLSFILATPTFSMYLGGDSGYDTHFKRLGDTFGGFDLAILENGQYNQAWQAIHMLPAETLQAARDLSARRLLPVHSSKFKLSVHPWYEPLTALTALNAASEQQLPILTPQIGEILYLEQPDQLFTEWWRDLQGSSRN